MYGSKRVAVRDLNPHILCALCGGYLIQATTVIECLHSFCRSCIVNFLETSKVCPICDAQIHKTRPLLNIRLDQTLQSLVYKLVPGLFQDEMRRRREFHATLSDSDLEDLSLEERGEASLEKEFKPGDDHVSLVLQLAFREDKSKKFEIRDRRYLLCPSEVTVHHLKKFIRLKFQLNDNHKIQMYRAREELSDDLMLQDIALIYSWHGRKPMTLCYTVADAPRSKTQSRHKQVTPTCQQVDPTNPDLESSDVESKSKSSNHGQVPSAKAKNASEAVATVSEIHLSFATASVVKPALVLPSHTMLTVPTTSTVTIPLPSVCNRVDKVLSNEKISDTSNANTKEFKSPPHVVSTWDKKSSSNSEIHTCVTAPSSTSKSKSQDAAKLMHSVESILSQTSRRVHNKNTDSLLSWTPVSESYFTFPDTVCKEKHGKTASTSARQCHLEHPVLESSKQTTDDVNNNPQHNGHAVAGFRRSQSVIESTSAVTEMNTDASRMQQVSINDSAKADDGIMYITDKEDVFSSYIPKFQKHRKQCAVKRSASYEGSSVTTVARTSTCGDAMEKRNWKKRKLSTLDFGSDNVVSSVTISPKTDSQNISQLKKVASHEQIIRSGSTSVEKMTTNSDTSVTNMGPGFPQISTPPSGDHSVPQTECYLPILLLSNDVAGSVTNPAVTDFSSEANEKYCQRKSVSASATSAANMNKICAKVSGGNRLSHSAPLGKADKSSLPGEKQRCVTDSHNESSNAYVNKKSVGYILKKSSKSGNNKNARTLVRGSTHSKTVEEITVDISSSPSDVSNVTSPATYVTSPGTEDRTDGSTLPEIQTSCDNSCVMTFSGKVVPLDLSSRKKK